MKVYTYAALIGRMEGLDDDTMCVLEAAAVVHDTGIKKAEELYGYNNGKLQEQYGPEAADVLLKECGYDLKDRERVCYLVAHHHTYTGMDGADYRILVEADFLVNMYEDDADIDAVRTAYDKIFTTESGKSEEAHALLTARRYGKRKDVHDGERDRAYTAAGADPRAQ